MGSKISEALKKEQRRREAAMTPEERLRAHASHCESMIKLFKVGQALRNARPPSHVKSGCDRTAPGR